MTTQTTTSLSPPVALITGAARRIGAEIARCLHHAGFNIVLHYHHSETDATKLAKELNELRSDSAVCVPADLRQHEQLASLAERALNSWGRLDALINNASTFYPTAMGEITSEVFDDLFGTNLQAPLFLSQACADALRANQGCIINIADIHGERPLKGYPVYCMAKAANIMLTKSLAKELAPNIRVNGVAPGAILWPEQAAELNDTAKTTILDRAALKRLGDPSDIATTIKFLVTEAPYITGQIIAVDGGRNLVS